MKGFKPTGYGPTSGFKFPANMGFTGSTGAYTNVQPYVRRNPRAFKDGGYVSESMPDPGSALVRRARPYTNEDQQSGGRSPLRPGFKDGGKNWIKGAIKHPGALHKTLGVPEGQKIPAKKLAKAAHSKNPTTRRRAALAKTLGKMHKADGGVVTRGALDQLNRSRKRAAPRPPTASTMKEKFAADGGAVRGSSAKPFWESVAMIPEAIKEALRSSAPSSGMARQAADRVSGRERQVDRAVDEAVTGKTSASNYSRGGKMRRMGYAKGGGVSREEAKKIAQRTIGDHVRYPAPKGHKGLGAMIKD